MGIPLTKIPAVLSALKRSLASQIRRELFRQQLRQRFPQAHFDWPITFVVDDYDSLSIGTGCYLGPYSEVVVLKHSAASSIPGSLRIENGARIGMGANIRAAGGAIRIGQGTQIGQHVNLVASNHMVDHMNANMHPDKWDTARTGITIGERCWIGAGVILLPGVTIGSDSVIGAGSVVTKLVGERQIWHGNPARLARSLS